VSTLVSLRARIVRAAKALAKAYDAGSHCRDEYNALMIAARQLVNLEKNKRSVISAGKKAWKTRRRNDALWKKRCPQKQQ